MISPRLLAATHDVPKMLDILFASFISNMEAAFCSVCSHKPNRNLQYISVGAENAKRKEQISIENMSISRRDTQLSFWKEMYAAACRER